MKKITILLFVVLILAASASCKKEKPAPSSVAPSSVKPPPSSSEEEVSSEIIPEGTELYNFVSFLGEVASAKSANSDAKGFVHLRNTAIRYPIYQSEDNEFYLNHGPNKRARQAGAVYADFRCTFPELSQNTVLYGHNQADGSMFGTLRRNYIDIEFLKKNPIIEFSTADKDYKFKIFAAFYSDINFLFNIPDFPIHEEFEYIVQGAIKRSQYIISNVPVDAGEKIVTLSTCAPDSMGDVRFVVMGRLLRDGEDLYALDAVPNPSPLKPKP